MALYLNNKICEQLLSKISKNIFYDIQQQQQKTKKQICFENLKEKRRKKKKIDREVNKIIC